MSPNLAQTLARGGEFAAATGAAEMTLEHLLAVLCDDPDAIAILDASHISIEGLRADVTARLFHAPHGAAPPHGAIGVAADVRRILEAAAAAARGSRRRDINGAIVLAAIVGDARSISAEILHAHGLTFDGAIRALQTALAPRVPVADDVLARARERVQSRAAPSLRDIMREVPQPVHPPPVAAPGPGPAHVEVEAERAAEPPAAVSAAPAEAQPQPSAPAEEADAAPAAMTGGAVDTPMPAGDPEPAPLSEGGASAEPVREAVEARPEPAVEAAPAAPVPGPAAPLQTAADQPGPAPKKFAPAGLGPRPENYDRVALTPAPAPAPSPAPAGAAGAAALPNFPAPSIEIGGYRPSFENAPQPAGSNRPAAGGDFPMFPRERRVGAMPPPIPGGQPMPPLSPAPGVGAAARAPFPAHGLAPQPQGAQPGLRIDHPAAAQAPQAKPQRAGKKGKGGKVEAGQLAENIPRAMRVGRTERAEVRIAKSSVKALAEGLEGGGAVWQHGVMVTKAMAVRLRAPEGGFFIESASPETQWIENNLGYSSDDFASWRFLITPRERGRARLQIVVSARTVGADGVAAETALPDQVVDVKVRRNVKRALGRLLGWTVAAVAGGALSTFGQSGLEIANTYMQKFIH